MPRKGARQQQNVHNEQVRHSRQAGKRLLARVACTCHHGPVKSADCPGHPRWRPAHEGQAGQSAEGPVVLATVVDLDNCRLNVKRAAPPLAAKHLD